jgi:hypothetical protein
MSDWRRRHDRKKAKKKISALEQMRELQDVSETYEDPTVVGSAART